MSSKSFLFMIVLVSQASASPGMHHACCANGLSRSCFAPPHRHAEELIPIRSASRLSTLCLRGGSSDAEMAPRLEVLDEWDMLTRTDVLGTNSTMLQSRLWPYCVIELWWESLGRFRFTYDELGEDIMCAFPQGSTSSDSGWDVQELWTAIKESRGRAALPPLPLELGSWKLEVNGTFLLITNKYQPDNSLILTDRGFYFFDNIGYAIKTEGNDPPVQLPAVDVCAEVGLRREHQKTAPVDEDYELPPKVVLEYGYS